ncbi:toll-like receptor 4 [Lytechinus pictus]|uniref:toll-like receptor 4 n=1 Tax=Lytechinus pictus TaxID=7653 RepID=UPI0030BA2712
MAIKCLLMLIFLSDVVQSIDYNGRRSYVGDDELSDYDEWSFVDLPTSSPSAMPMDATDVCDFQKWQKFVNCSERNLTAVPYNIPADTEILHLGFNLLFRLRNDSFTNLTQLRELYVESAELTNIESSVFVDLGELEILDLHGNSFSDLPGDLFVNNSNLIELNLGNNRFDSIPCETLMPLTRLRKLLLFLNNINWPYCEHFPNLASGAIVSLSRNDIPVIRLGNFQFLENCTLSSLFLGGNRITAIDYRAVVSLKTQALDMSYNPLNEIGIANLFYGFRMNDMLRSIELRSSLINSNDPSTFIFLKNKTIDYLGVSSNRFTSIPLWSKFLNHVRNLSLADNSIYRISNRVFLEMTALEEINLENNQILRLETLTNETRWSATQLRTFKLAQNRLDNIPDNVFLGLENLTSLDLHSNPITYLTVESLKGLQQLETLDLSETRLTSIASGTFRFVPNLKILNFRNADLRQANPLRFLIDIPNLESIDLSGNNLQTLDLWNEYFQVSIFSGNTRLREIRLDNNPIIVDIPARTFENLTSLSILSLNVCGLKSIQANIFTTLVNLTSLSFNMNTISQLPTNLLWNLKSLETFSAAENSFTTLDSSIFKHTLFLRYISLPNNAITFIAGDSMSHLSELRTFDLHGNPIACTCALEPFSDWLKVTNASLIGEERTLCSPSSFEGVVGNSILDFEPASFCGPNIALLVSIPALAVILIISVALSFQYRYWIRYKYFMLKLSLFGYRRYEERDVDDYEYHINVMFAADDQPWVDDYLKPIIRGQFPEKDIHNDMVFGDEDLIPGMYYLDAIHYSVIHSYKTLLLLSYAAIRDEWFTTKFRLALEHVNETQVEKVVIIFLEHIEDKDLPFLVRVFLSKNKPYLRWTDDEAGREYFKESLVKSVEVNMRCDNTIPV